MEVFDRVSGGGDHTTLEKFTAFLRDTFPGCEEDIHFGERARRIFEQSCENDVLSRGEFLNLWRANLEKCFKPRSAVVVVDFQNDFIDGSLSLKRCSLRHDPSTLLPCLNDFIAEFDEAVYTLDWHPNDHISFIESRFLWKLHRSNQIDPVQVKVGEELVFEIENGKAYAQKMWPRHCVQQTDGAKLRRDLKVKENAIIVRKGSEPRVDSYSAFWDNLSANETNLRRSLQARGITNLFVVGIAFDACVLATACDAVVGGFTTSVVEDLTAGISEASSREAHTKLAEIHCPCLSTKQALQVQSRGPLPWIYVWQQIESSKKQPELRRGVETLRN